MRLGRGGDEDDGEDDEERGRNESGEGRQRNQTTRPCKELNGFVRKLEARVWASHENA